VSPVARIGKVSDAFFGLAADHLGAADISC
jgi:hypothetical protein